MEFSVMKLFSKALILLSFLFVLGGCATFFYGTKKPIYIASEPSNTPVYINNKYVGETPLLLNRKYKAGNQYLSVRLSDSEDEKYNQVLQKEFRPISLLGAPLILPLVGDVLTGAINAHAPATYTHNFTNPGEPITWNYKLVYEEDSFAIDPLQVFERARKERGFINSASTTEENYAQVYGPALTGVYTANDTAFKVSANLVFNENNGRRKFKGTDISYYSAYSYTSPFLSRLLYPHEIVPVSYHLVELNKIQRIERHSLKKLLPSGSAKIDDEQAKTTIPENLYQYWFRLTGSGDKTILFQAHDLKSNSELAYYASPEIIALDYYFMFMVKGQGQYIEISPDELKENIGLFTSNPYLKNLANLSSSGNDMMVKLNKNPAYLTNILNWEWSNQTGEPFFEIMEDSPKKKEEEDTKEADPEEQPKRDAEPAIVVDNSTAPEENKKSLDTFTGKMKELKPTGVGTPEDDSEKYYGSEAPWYLQGQLKPEYRKSAKQMGYQEEEAYDPTPKKIDSTAWLKERQFDLVSPEVDTTYKAGYDPGYINPEDPRKKPEEQKDTPWYLKKTTKPGEEAPKKEPKKVEGRNP